MWTRAAFALPFILFPAACGKSFESAHPGSGDAAMQGSGGNDSGVGAGPSAGRSGAGGAPPAAGGRESAGGGVSDAGGVNPGTGGNVSVGGTNAGGTNTGGANTGGANNSGGANTGGANTGGANTGGANTGGANNSGGANVATGGKPGTSCTVVVKQEVDEGAEHSTDCAKLTYGSNPPSSGTHYPSWAAFKFYSKAIPEGYWVHDLEHGAVVITYNCPTGCAAEISQMTEMINALPVDALCIGANQGVVRRIVVTPDPKLTTRFAASAWNWTLRAPCFDRAAFEGFIAAHYGHGTEDLCGNGVDLSLGFPAGCGE